MTYEVVSTTVTHRGRLATVRVDEVRMPDGQVHAREVVEQSDAVGVVALDDAGAVVLVRQYRHAIRDYALEIPAGKLDVDGEAAADAARRELAEEVGLEADELRVLGRFYNSAGWTTESTTLYLATGLRPVRLDDFSATAEEADMQEMRVPLFEAVRQVVAGEIVDAKTVIGLLLADAHLR